MKFFLSLMQRYDKWKLKNDSFTIFSNDCWGGEVYHYFNLAYNTPFIGLYVMAPCYIKFLQDHKFYLSQSIEFSHNSKYENVQNSRIIDNKVFLTGHIKDIEIQFLHYSIEDEALDKWNRRKARINFDNLFIKFDGSKDGANLGLIQAFDELPYRNKICISNTKIDDIHSLVYCPTWLKDGALVFKESKKYFHLVDWLNGKGLRLK